MIEQRRTKRFDLHLPVEIVRAGAERISRFGRTRNISSGGVLFTASSRMEIGSAVEYIVTLAGGGTTTSAVSLRCMGKVLRLEPLPADNVDNSFTVAVSLERYEFLRSNGQHA
ncbi:MAG: PilZ domain-containing protein [Bryobacteraceae bacterium]